MTDKQPEALRLADGLEKVIQGLNPTRLEMQIAALLRTQHAAIERANAAIIESSLEREGLMAVNLEMLAAIERKDALLRQAEQMMRWAADIMVLSPQDAPGFFDDLNAIKQELSQ